MTKTLKLSKSVEAHGEKIETLEFREITTDDIIECGHPFTFYTKDQGTLETKINTDIALKYIIRLAGVPKSTIKALAPQDFMNAVTMVMDFFGDMAADTTKE